MDSEKRDKTVTGQLDVPFVAYERAEAAFERNIKRLWITVIVLIALLFASNMIWLAVYASFDYADYEVSADNNANANYIGGDMDGDINNGGKNQSEDTNTQERSETDQNESENAQQ